MSWSPPDSGSTPTNYDIYYAPSRYKPSKLTVTSYTSTDTSYLLTGLTPATWYYAWVRTRSATCYSVWSLVDSFKTLCAPTVTPTSPEPFNKPFPPNCWQKGLGLLSNPTSFSYISEYSQYWKGRPYKNNPGSDSAANTAFSIDSLHHWLVSPPYDLGTAGNKSLEFDAALTTNSIINPLQAYFAADDKLVVVISTDEGLTWSSANALRTFTAPQVIPYTGAHYAIPLSSYSGIVRIGFYAQSTVGNLTGGSTPNLFIDNVKVSEILPVKLLEFTGKKEGNTNLLQWRTATEQNNRGFELQRAPSNSPPAAEGLPPFATLAFVPTKANGGNSTSQLSYAYTDEHPPRRSMGAYYRLKQVDFDGKFTYSNVVFIKGEPFTELALSALFPNPTRQLLNVVFQSPKAQQVQIIIADIAGKTVQQQTLQLQKGENNKTVNVAALSKGTYIVKVICADGCEAAVSKFVKE